MILYESKNIRNINFKRSTPFKDREIESIPKMNEQMLKYEKQNVFPFDGLKQNASVTPLFKLLLLLFYRRNETFQPYQQQQTHPHT